MIPHLRPTFLVLPGLLILGLTLRVLGTRFGFPMLVHPDEGAVVMPAGHMIMDRTLDPGFFKRPNHFSIYWSAALYGPFSQLFMHEPFAAVRQSNPTFLYLVSRLIVAAMGTLSIVVAYYLGREFNRRTAYVLAGLVAVFPLYVDHSHYATPDVPLTLLLMLVMLFLVRFLSTGSFVYLAAAVGAAALSTIEKYPGAMSILMILCVVLVALRSRPRVLIVSMMATSVAFPLAVLAFSPYLLLRSRTVLAELSNEARNYHLGADGLGWIGNLRFYAEAYYLRAGLVMVVASIIGLAVVLRRRDVRAVPFLFSAGYWLALSALALHWERWALPMYLGPLALAAVGVDTVAARAQRRVRRGEPGQAVIVCIAVIFSFGAMTLAGLSKSLVLSLPDTRIAAQEYLSVKGIGKGEAIYDGYSPFNPSSPVSAATMVEAGEDTKARYAVLSSAMYERYLRDPDRYPDEASFYRRLLGSQPLRVFSPAPATSAIQREVQDLRTPLYLVPELGSLIHSLRFLAYRIGGGEDAFNGPTIKVFRYPAPG